MIFCFYKIIATERHEGYLSGKIKKEKNNEIITVIKFIRACIYSFANRSTVQINVSRNRPKIRLSRSKQLSSTLIVNIILYIGIYMIYTYTYTCLYACMYVCIFLYMYFLVHVAFRYNKIFIWSNYLNLCHITYESYKKIVE